MSKKIANRKGLKTRLYDYETKALVQTIDYGNVTTIEDSQDRVWATGGENMSNEVAFDNPSSGTFTISSQIIPLEYIALAATSEGLTTGNDLTVAETLVGATEDSSVVVTLSKTPVVDPTKDFAAVVVYEHGVEIKGATPLVTSVDADTKKVTITSGVAGTKYDVYYLTTEASSKSVTFNDNVSTGTYIIDSDTVYKEAGNTTPIAEQIRIYKAVPQKGITLTYQGGTGDPMSVDITFDFSADDDGNVKKITRL